MNLEERAEDLGLEPDDFLTLLGLFVETTEADLERLDTALQGGDLDEVARIAHHIKGAATNLDLEGPLEAAKQMESEAANNDSENLANLKRRIADSLQEIIRSLEEWSA
jgi:HPt (histidine-containing phosphotransfer) domain-containing protein